MSLEERFHAAVDAIQKLPASGSFQPSNLTKLIFYGLYKQATVGPCNEPKPSTFNIRNRAKWEAWDRNRAMNKEEAMKAYLAEIRNLIQTMPNSDEVVAFKKLVDPPEQNAVASSLPTLRDKSTSISSVLSTSSSVSSLSASEMDEFFDDPSDQALADHYEIISPSTSFYPIANVTSNGNNSFTSSEHSTIRLTTHSNDVGSSTSSTGDMSRETQKAILSALMKLQDDVHHILERLNRLETSDIILQQRELLLSSDTNTPLSWLPLAGLRRRAIAFILLWPFIALGLIRLFQRARIIIRFRQRKIV